MSDWQGNIAAFMKSECDAILGPYGDEYTQEPVVVYAVAIARIEALTAQLAQRDAALKAADDLARAAYMTGSVWSTPIPNALAAYRKARGQDEPAKG